MEYLKAVLNNDKAKEIDNLKILISTGKKLNKNISKYESELNKYNKENKKHIKIEPIKIEEPKKIEKAKISKKIKEDTDNYKYTIKSVESRNNMVIIDFKSPVSKNFIKFSEEKAKSGFQDIYDIKGSFKDAHPTKLKIDGVKQIVIKQETPTTLRILFEDNKNLKTIYFFVNNKRLILKVLDVEKENKTTTNKIVKKAKKVQYRPGLNKVVVIDAGHGGKDVGAVGPNKRYEKIVVFEVTKYLESYLKKRGYKVYLTRNKDRFIKVRNRTILANEKKADIFVSVHANAAHKSKVNKLNGIETFFLSPARSERAKRVAAKENSSDVRNMSGSTKKAFLESLNRPRITASHKLSIDIQRNMLFSTRKIHKDVIDGGVREGPFWVLVGAQMPSVLIELGYITHPKESKRLYNSKYQKALAEGIANGIDSYFLKNP
ncbi:N-acetylmuramoyl-L-alanine amidase [Halarcobacter bivalviorum]|uniref:N-acetylmuramoyl-L-alanine amidase n=1 Tax=Halarcobacter bivalviorum TaxID=663364 RepID=A0AAX2A6Y0_9BACT|nr:N-acetylmuramoyl-L-alanine amidase [Halarcobacter bivalviorum]AXH12787.1 N-acetylmuramoyl-L-alanine amidase [Halarcobacter bivalviorum]RXK09088.1 N-acetylmuramoyl-L-alanine amidase [Halarcobacter bivalviorum]